MRVIGGSARGCRLKPPAGGARATSDLIRGAIFDALEARDADFSRVLDVYAGSGALGIEALSRGAEQCDFIESDPANVAIIRANLARAILDERGSVHRMRVEQAAERLEGPYSLVLADPPYDDEGAPGALERLAGSPLVDPARTALVLEQSSRHDLPSRMGPLALSWSRRHGDTQVAFYGPEPA